MMKWKFVEMTCADDPFFLLYHVFTDVSLCLRVAFYSLFIFQYYYSVRIFAGQEPSGVWIGWVTPDYHQFDPSFDLSKVRSVTVTVGDDKGNIHNRLAFSNQKNEGGNNIQ